MQHTLPQAAVANIKQIAANIAATGWRQVAREHDYARARSEAAAISILTTKQHRQQARILAVSELRKAYAAYPSPVSAR